MPFFSDLSKTLDNVGRDVSRGIDSASRSVNKSVNEHWSSALLDMFMSGNVVQLVSRRSGRSLQIVAAPDGRLVVDGCGPEGAQVYHTHWTVTNYGKNIVTLQNQCNYLAVIDGITQVVTFPSPQQVTQDAHFRLAQQQNCICFESVKHSNSHVGVIQTGELKSALATRRDMDGQWAVRLIYSPHPPKPAKAGAQPVGATAPPAGTAVYPHPPK